MSFFDKGVDPAEFDKYKSEVDIRFRQLTEEIERKASDSEVSALESASNASKALASVKSIEGQIEQALAALISYKDTASGELIGITDIGKQSKVLLAEVSDVAKAGEEARSAIVQQQSSMSEVFKAASADLAMIKAALQEVQNLPGQVENGKKLLEGAAAVSKDMESLLTHSMKKKSDIDDLHKSILGAEVKAADGSVERIDGLLDELQNSYDSIKSKTEDMEGKVDGTVKELLEKHELALASEKDKFEQLLDVSNKRYAAINDEISGLLPGAMAAGLSAAYEKKKDDEIKSLSGHEFKFLVAIGLMVGVSLIPFGVDVFLLGWKGNDLVEVIKGTPNLIVSILPLYFPVLWFAYSSSKKLNLSKRLIEEYTHKAVLGRTFSGLSNQIESLPRESIVRDELRTKLLFNMLQVSSENPGKLITDYNKTDHPLMDALENSAKLSDSIESLSKLPGFSALAKKLSAKTDELLSAQTQKVESGLAAQEEIEKPTQKAAADSEQAKV
ncbi:hypothetical protein [Pseudomonas sp. TE3-3-F2023]|uniref:hypothetical protein n=1 Tax=Pseudomonas sp. TE3-3-F2023 TaxID=3119004 RepID=UPI0030D5B824